LQLNLTVVEIDPEIVQVAKDHFGLPDANERLKVVVDDGLEFIQSTGKFC
jgi:spermidine synthase